MNKAAKIVSSAIIGTSREIILVNGKQYVIKPPTIHRLAGTASCLCVFGLSDKPTLRDILLAIKDINVCSEALSWLINGDESLSDELSLGAADEVIEGLEKGLSLISTEVFLRAVSLAKNVVLLTAKPKQ